MLSLGFSLTDKISLAQQSYDPPFSLFSNDEQGWLLDLSRDDCRFTTALGVTPALAHGNPIGLILDSRLWQGRTRQQEFNRQPEIWPQPNFASSAGLAVGASWSIAGGVATCDGSTPSGMQVAGALTVGKTYEYLIRVPSRISGALTCPYDGNGVNGRNVAGAGLFSGLFTALGPNLWVWSSNFVGTVDLCLIREIPGNHFRQTTDANRPQLNISNGLYSAAFNGSNSFWQSAAPIDFSASDKATMIAGVYKPSDPALNDASRMIVELSSNSGTTAGTWSFYQQNTTPFPNRFWEAFSRGTAVATGGNSAVSSAVAPDTAVITGLHDISGDLSRLRRNGAVATDGLDDKGSGNFRNDTVYIGRRGGSTLPWPGRIYNLIARTGLIADPQLSQAERWSGQKSGVSW